MAAFSVSFRKRVFHWRVRGILHAGSINVHCVHDLLFQYGAVNSFSTNERAKLRADRSASL